MEPFRDRQRFSSMFALSESVDNTVDALLSFMECCSWRRIAVLTERFPYYDGMTRVLLEGMLRRNMSLSWIGKVSHSGVDYDEMDQNFQDLASTDPRVIVVNADLGASKACWLHKYKLFGPNYVLFFTYFSDIHPTPFVPDDLKSWCSLEMINEVLVGAFFYGDSFRSETFGNEMVQDSTGLSTKQFDDNLRNMIENPEEIPFWGYWRLLPYEVTLMAGFVLNETEHILNERNNQTLLDWVLGSENFQSNGLVFLEILKEALFKVKFNGQRGFYNFDRKTKVNSNGYTPVSFTQLQGHLRKATVVAYYQSNATNTAKMKFRNELLWWRTKNGLIPNDSVITVINRIEPLSKELFAFYMTIASFVIIFLITLSLLSMSSSKLSILSSKVKYVGLMGFLSTGFLIVIMSHTFALPGHADLQINRNCSAVFSLITFGYALMTLLVKNRLYWSLQQMRFQATKEPDIIKELCIFVPLQLIAFCVALSIFPIRQHLHISANADGFGEKYRHEFLSLECSTPDFSHPMSIVLYLVIFLWPLWLVLQTIWLCVKVRSHHLHTQNTHAMSFVRAFYYGSFLIAIGILIVLIAPRYEFIAITPIITVYCFVNIFFIIWPMVCKKAEIDQSNNTSIRQKRP